MSQSDSVRIVLASRPEGRPSPQNFRQERAALPAIAEGQVLLKILYLSLDPYMRGRMSAAKSYAAPTEIGQVMEGGTVAEVLESRDPAFKPGDLVLSYSGWQSHAVAEGAQRDVREQVEPDTARLDAHHLGRSCRGDPALANDLAGNRLTGGRSAGRQQHEILRRRRLSKQDEG